MGKYTKIKADGGPIKTVRISDKGEVKDVPINTKKYKEYYDSKTLAKASEDPNLLIAAQDLNPYEVKAEKPTWLTFKEEALKNYPESKFRNEYFLPALKPSDLDSLPQNALDEYNKRINNTVAQRLLKERNLDKNWDAKTQVGAFTQGERDIILNSDYGEDLARNVRLYDAELADKESYSNTDNKADLLRRKSQATGDKFRFSNKSNFFDDYINPGVMVGNMASNLGAAPDNWNRGNYLSAIGAVAAPIGVGRLASIGAPTTTQFVNNVVNPLAGTGNLIKGVVPASVKTITKAKNLREAVGTFAGIPTERSLPRLAEQDLKAYRAVQELGRLRDLDKPIADQYEYALLNLPEEHIKRIYGKSKDELTSLLKTTKESAANYENVSAPFDWNAINPQRNGRGGIDITNTIDLRRPVTNEIRRRYNIPPSDLINTPNYGPVINELDPSLMPHLVDNAPIYDDITSYPIYDDLARSIRSIGQTKNSANTVINNAIKNQATKVKQGVGNYLSEYPVHRGDVKQNVPGLFLRGSTKKGVQQNVADMASHGVESGDVFAGSLNTSHSSYLPQLKRTFDYKDGAQQFLNYRPMNRSGYLSQAGYSPDEIASYLNTEIDTHIGRGKLPSNIQRPFVKKGDVVLPQYGVKQYQYGGYINNNMNRKKYADGGPIKGKPKPAIMVNDLNDPRLLAYNDSLSTYNKFIPNKNDIVLTSKNDLKWVTPFNPNDPNDIIWENYLLAHGEHPFDAWNKFKEQNTINGNAPIGFNMTSFTKDRHNPVHKKPEQPYEYSPRQETLNIPSIQYNPKDTNPYNSNVVSRYLPTPESPTNPKPYNAINLYTAHQILENEGKPIGQINEDGKWRNIMADEYNAIMGSSVQGGTKLENTNYAMGGKLNKKYAMGGRMNQAQQLNAGKMRVGSDAPDGSVWKDIGAGAFGVLEGTLDTVTMGATDKLTDAAYKGLQKLGGSDASQIREQDMIHGFSSIGGAAIGAAVNPASGMTAVSQGIKGLGQGVGNINENTQGIGNAISGLSGLTGLIPSGGGNIGSNGQQEMEQMGAAMKHAQGGLMHINEGGTHEQNALGGVPIGPNALVEQGETINNDFVFSDRLKPKGSKRTYAQLSKSVDTKYKLRPDDKLSKEAKQMDLDRLAMQQETQKDEMSTKYMQKAMACGGKIKGFGGQIMGPISQSMNVTNGQNTLLAMGGNLPNYDYGDDGNIRRSPYNNMVNAVDNGINNVNYQPSNDVLFNDYMQRDGFNPTLEDYNKVVLGQKQAAMGGLMSNFMEQPSVYQNPANLSNQYAMGGNMYGNGGGTGGTSYLQYDENGNPLKVPLASAKFDPRFSIPNAENLNYTDPDSLINPLDNAKDYSYLSNPQYNDSNYNPEQLVSTQSNLNTNNYLNNLSPLDRLNMNPAGQNLNKGIQSTFHDSTNNLDPANQVNRIMDSTMNPNTKINIQSIPYYNPQVQGRNVSSPMNVVNNPETNFMGQKQGNAFDKYAGTNQNPYPEVGNTGYLTNLAGNLVKAGMVATSKPPIYNPSLKLNRMNANPAERLAMQEGRREIQGTKDIIRNNATSSGQYLTNASLMGSSAANKLAGTIGGIRQGYDQQNVGIGNQEAQLNQQITAGNNLAKETFRDNRLNQYNKILDSVIGANQQRFSTDVHANNYQNQVVEFLKTKGFRIGYKDGKLQMLDANNNVVNTEK